MSKAELFLSARLGRAAGARMLLVPTGFGVGTYPIYELRHKSKRCGIEVLFIKPREPYPFGAGGRLNYREFLMSLIEHCWHDIWAAPRAKPTAAREFLGQLSPGCRAFFAIEVLNRHVMLKTCSVGNLFTDQFCAVLVDEVLNALSLLHADEYAERFQKVLSLCRPITELPDWDARKATLLSIRERGGAEGPRLLRCVVQEGDEEAESAYGRLHTSIR